jgi:hypothetical protein
MNDFRMDLTGMTAVLKPRNFWRKPSTAKQRTLTVLSGPGCNPDPAWGRNIICQCGTARETISSYDLEYVIKGKVKIYQTDERSEP